MSSISFANALMFIILVPLVALMVVPFAIAVRKENANVHNIASFVLHIFMAVVIAFAAAGTSYITVVTETEVYVVADYSYSTELNCGEVDGYIADISKNLPKNAKLGVVAFGKDSELLVPLGGKLKSVRTSSVDRSESDIASAMEYCGTLFKGDSIKRMVVISDGRQTDGSAAMKRAANSLRAQNIQIDAIFTDSTLADGVCEFQASAVAYTQNAYKNRGKDVTANIYSNVADRNAFVSLYDVTDGEELVSRQFVTMSQGMNNVGFTLDTSEPGEHEYEVRVEGDGDVNPYNNFCRFTQTVSGSMKVLFISDRENDGDMAGELFEDGAEVHTYINERAVPYTVEALCAYDEIVLSNCDITKLENSGMFAESLNKAVQQFGKSLVTIGDMHIQNSDAVEHKMLSDILPVRYGKRDTDPKCYTIVMDISRSMLWQSRLAIAKTAARSMVELLNDNDLVSLVVFYGDSHAELQFTRAADSVAIINAIEKPEVIQGTVMSAPLKLAENMLVHQTASEKQVMFISDGMNSGSDALDPRTIAASMAKNGIAVNVMDVGRLGMDIATIPGGSHAEALLKDIATFGGGKYFYADDVEDAHAVSFGAIADMITESVVEDYTWVEANRSYDPALAGMSVSEKTHYVRGYVVSTAKPSATTVLRVRQASADGYKNGAIVPIYSYWDYGDGKVSTYTGGINDNELWLYKRGTTDPAENAKLFTNVFDGSVPAERHDCPFNTAVTQENGSLHLELVPAELAAGAEARVAVTLPDGSVTEKELVFDSAKYCCDIRVDSAGKYGVTFGYSYGGNDYKETVDYSISFLPEYDSFTLYDAAALYAMVGGYGVVSEDGRLSLENAEGTVGKYTVDLTPVFVIVAVSLFVVDIIVRKLKWDDIRSIFVKIGKKEGKKS